MNQKQKDTIREEFLKSIPCIVPDCDGKGNIPHQVGEDEWEAQQCQYCYEIRFKQYGWWLSKIDQACNEAYQLGAKDKVEEVINHPAFKALSDYQQADYDGVMVLVSRQAIEETKQLINNLNK